MGTVSVILEFDKMPQNCEKCRMLLKVSKLCAYCMATGFQIKYDETDLRDGMCPLEEKIDNSEIYEWERLGENAMVCGKCGKGLSDKHGYGFVLYEFDYCPFCGAKMNKKTYEGGVIE